MRVLPVIVTVSICETILIVLAVLGVSLILFTFSWLKIILYCIGFFFLIYKGWVLWTSKPTEKRGDTGHVSIKKQIVFTASISLLNPHAIIDFDTIGVIGTNSLSYSGQERLIFTLSTILYLSFGFLGLLLSEG